MKWAILLEFKLEVPDLNVARGNLLGKKLLRGKMMFTFRLEHRRKSVMYSILRNSFASILATTSQITTKVHDSRKQLIQQFCVD
jgi:hypothetical protein